MEKLNELVELAEKATHGEWTTDARGGVVAVDDQANNGFVICAVSGCDKTSNAAFIAAANPATILDIAEAFRDLEQRAEAAEAKLAELEKQKAVGVARMELTIGKEGLRYYQCFVDMRPDLVVAELNTGMELFTCPAPAVNLAELVPDSIEPEQVPDILDPTANPDEYACCVGRDMWEACRAAILRNIEGEK